MVIREIYASEELERSLGTLSDSKLAEWARLNRAYHTVFDSPQRRILPGGVVSDPKRPTPSLRIRSPRLEPLLALGISCEKT